MRGRESENIKKRQRKSSIRYFTHHSASTQLEHPHTNDQHPPHSILHTTLTPPPLTSRDFHHPQQ